MVVKYCQKKKKKVTVSKMLNNTVCILFECVEEEEEGENDYINAV